MSLTPAQVLDLSSNGLDDAAASTLAGVLAGGALHLQELMLLGNKFPLALPTLRLLMQVRRVC